MTLLDDLYKRATSLLENFDQSKISLEKHEAAYSEEIDKFLQSTFFGRATYSLADLDRFVTVSASVELASTATPPLSANLAIYDIVKQYKALVHFVSVSNGRLCFTLTCGKDSVVLRYDCTSKCWKIPCGICRLAPQLACAVTIFKSVVGDR